MLFLRAFRLLLCVHRQAKPSQAKPSKSWPKRKQRMTKASSNHATSRPTFSSEFHFLYAQTKNSNTKARSKPSRPKRNQAKPSITDQSQASCKLIQKRKPSKQNKQNVANKVQNMIKAQPRHDQSRAWITPRCGFHIVSICIIVTHHMVYELMVCVRSWRVVLLQAPPLWPSQSCCTSLCEVPASRLQLASSSWAVLKNRCLVLLPGQCWKTFCLVLKNPWTQEPMNPSTHECMACLACSLAWLSLQN